MGLLDKIKSAAAETSTRMQETHIKLRVTSGKKNFFLGPLDGNVVVLRVNDSGYIYFDDIEGTYKVSDFEWGGIMYETVAQTTGKETTRSDFDTNGKQKRTGRGIGAVAGGLVAGPVGAVAGAMLGTGNKKTNERTKGRSNTRSSLTTVTSQSEVASTAYMTLSDPSNNVTFSFGFDCDSRIYGELRNVFLRTGYES